MGIWRSSSILLCWPSKTICKEDWNARYTWVVTRQGMQFSFTQQYHWVGSMPNLTDKIKKMDSRDNHFLLKLVYVAAAMNAGVVCRARDHHQSPPVCSGDKAGPIRGKARSDTAQILFSILGFAYTHSNLTSSSHAAKSPHAAKSERLNESVKSCTVTGS